VRSGRDKGRYVGEDEGEVWAEQVGACGSMHD
jgi:hypothetical protein